MSVPFNESGSYLSTTQTVGDFLAPDNVDSSSTVSRERGGIAISDPTEGLLYQDWVATYNGATNNVEIASPNSPISTLFNQSNLTQLSLAFDQNMRPFIAFVADGIAQYWWYDSEDETRKITALPVGSLTPRCCMDDKRVHKEGVSDIILCYVEAGALKMRIQRERYVNEHIIVDPLVHPITGQPGYLNKVGMNIYNQLQWLCNIAVQ